jgi:hypothetical protein
MKKGFKTSGLVGWVGKDGVIRHDKDDVKFIDILKGQWKQICGWAIYATIFMFMLGSMIYFYTGTKNIPKNIDLFEMTYPEGMMKGTNGRWVKKVWLVTARLDNRQAVEYYDDTETLVERVNKSKPIKRGAETW